MLAGGFASAEAGSAWMTAASAALSSLGFVGADDDAEADALAAPCVLFVGSWHATTSATAAKESARSREPIMTPRVPSPALERNAVALRSRLDDRRVHPGEDALDG